LPSPQPLDLQPEEMMRADLDELLFKRYPHIFGNGHAAGTSGMSWGFSHGDGWFWLVDTLCEEIQRHVERDGAPTVLARQVKEKLGTLRFHYQGGDEFIAGLVAMAQGLSAYVCEVCAAPGCCVAAPFAPRCPEHVQRRNNDAGPCHPVPGCDLPLAIRNPGWRHLAEALLATLDNDMRYGVLAPVSLEAVIETEALSFRWRGGDGKSGRAAGMLRMLEAYSLRCGRLSGRPDPHR
jgi:hypothetical protein